MSHLNPTPPSMVLMPLTSAGYHPLSPSRPSPGPYINPRGPPATTARLPSLNSSLALYSALTPSSSRRCLPRPSCYLSAAAHAPVSPPLAPPHLPRLPWQPLASTDDPEHPRAGDAPSCPLSASPPSPPWTHACRLVHTSWTRSIGFQVGN
jgi:hypothetical protein